MSADNHRAAVDLFECGDRVRLRRQGAGAGAGRHASRRRGARPARPCLVGPDTLDDAGVYRFSDEQCLVQTVDFFPPVARDPEDYGRIAAANSLSDVYAMGGKPLTALAIVCFPSELVRRGVLGAITRGASEKLREAGCVLLGGHSVLDPQLKFGLCVTGVVHPGELLTNAQARPGDVLVLTKPLGTGVTIMAIRAGMASAEQERAANRSMAALNAKAAELARRCGARCVTDITGFGLLGHAMQLARASGVALEIGVDGVPLLDGALDVRRAGAAVGRRLHQPGLRRRRRAVRRRRDAPGPRPALRSADLRRPAHLLPALAGRGAPRLGSGGARHLLWRRRPRGRGGGRTAHHGPQERGPVLARRRTRSSRP